MSDDTKVSPDAVSRREALKTALKTGAYVTPIVLSVGAPAVLEAQVSGPTGTLTGTITNASNGAPISGATVAVGAASTQTNQSGVYTLSNAPSGNRTVTTSASGFTTRNDPVNIAAGSTTNFSTSLVPASAGGNITIVLTWGANPRDLDSHLTGPDGVGGRFHCYYANPNPVTFVSLDHDVTSGFGPETITVQPLSGNFVAGTYNYYVHHFSGTSDLKNSGGIVTVFQSGSQVAQFQASAAAGAVTIYWSVMSFTLTATATGGISVTSVQQFVASPPSSPGFTPTPKS